MKRIAMPDFINEHLRTVYEKTRLTDPKAHVSEVLFCLGKSFLRRVFRRKDEETKQVWMAGLGWEREMLSFVIEERKQLTYGTTDNPEVSGLMPDLIATLDGVVNSQEYGGKVGVETKLTRWNMKEPTDTYVNQCVMYNKMSGLKMILLVRSFCPEYRTDFYIFDDENMRPYSYFVKMNERGVKLLKSISLFSSEYFGYMNGDSLNMDLFKIVPELEPQYEWECGYCEYAVECPKAMYIVDAMERNEDALKEKWKKRLVKVVRLKRLDLKE